MALGGALKQTKTEIVKPDVDYRKLTHLNYSLLKKWNDNPIEFYEIYKLGKVKKGTKSSATVIGDIAHFHLLDCGGSDQVFEQRMDEKFTLYSGVKGSGQVFLLCDELFKITLDSMNENGNITVDFEERFEQAFEKMVKMEKYKKKTVKQALDDFYQNGCSYFETLMENVDKQVVTEMELEVAKKSSKRILYDPNTADIFTGEGYNSFPIEWEYTFNGNRITAKSELDRFKIDRRNKTIQPYDPKFSWDNEDGFVSNYLRFGYYLQQAYYWLSLEHKFHVEEDEQYADYTILPMKYIAADTSINNRRPLVYECTERDLQAGLYGFTHNGRYYKGVHQLVEEILWAEKSDTWDISREALMNNGVMKLNFDYHK